MRNQRSVFSLAFLVVAITHGAMARGQDSSPSGDQPTYSYEVWGTSTQQPTRQRPWSEPYDSKAAAQARLLQLKKDYSSGGLMRAYPDKPLNLQVVERVRSAVDKASVAKKVKAAEHRVGDTLKEYANQIKSVYERIVHLKHTLGSGVRKLSSEQLASVNREIDSYNRLRDDVDRQFPGDDECATLLQRYPAMDRVPPQPASGGPAQTETMVGVWIWNSVVVGVRCQKRMTVRADGTGFTDDYQNGRFVRRDAFKWKRDGGRFLATDLKGRFSDDTDFIARNYRKAR